MIMIIKAIGVLFLDIAIYYVIGTAITERFKNRIKLKEKKDEKKRRAVRAAHPWM